MTGTRPDSPVRVGFLGAGLIATFHSKMLRRSGEEVVWAGVHDPDAARAEHFARASGATVCATEEEVLDGCDAVYVCTWTSEHARLVEAACERGLPVFCEKPLATSLDEARRMTALVGDAGIVNQVGLVLRRSPAFQLVRDLVHEPSSGRVMSVVFRDDQHLPVRGSYGSSWRADVARAGAGTLLEHSIHDVDLLDWLVGPIETVAARSGEFHQLPGIEDVMVATLGFAGGGIGSLVSVWHDVDPRGSLRRVEVFCERAWIALEGDWFGPVTWTRADGSTGRLEGDELVEATAPLLEEHGGNPDGAFVRCVREGRPAHPDFATALRAHEIVEAMYASAREGGSTRTVG